MQMQLTLLNDSLLTTPDVERVTKIKRRTLERYRLLGQGPRFIRVGGGVHARLVRYRLSDVEAWIQQRAA